MKILDLNINLIESKENIRQTHDEAASVSLMQSIKDLGLMQPIGVVLEDKKYFIVWGNRRLDSCKKLGWKTIPAVLFREGEESIPEEEFMIINAQENLQHKQNNLSEIGRVCEYLRDKKDMSISEISARLSIPKKRVESALIEMKRIPPIWRPRVRIMNGDMVKKGDIPMSTATRISAMHSLSMDQKSDIFKWISKEDFPLSQSELIGSLVKDGSSVKEAVNSVKKYRPLSLKLFADVEKLSELESIKKQTIISLISEAVNKVYPGLIVRNIRRS